MGAKSPTRPYTSPRGEREAAMVQAPADPRFAQGKLLDLENGLVARRIFSDPELYEREMKQVFHRCWIFLGHESYQCPACIV